MLQVFIKKYQHWTEDDWVELMFANESCFYVHQRDEWENVMTLHHQLL